MKKVGIIINPNAKKIRTEQIHMEDFSNFDENIVIVKITRSVDDIDVAIKQLKMEDVDCIGIVGGDGTIHQILTRIITIYSENEAPPLLILKGGTMNLVSKSIHLRGSGVHILRRLVESIKKGKEIEIYERDTMQIDGRYCFLFGIGIVTNFLNEVYKGEKGAMSNLRGFIKAIEHSFNEPEEDSLFKGIDGTVLLDNNPVAFSNISAILAGTVEYISSGMPTLYKANKEKRKFHAIVTNLTKFKLLKNLYVAWGIPSFSENIISDQVSEIQVKAHAPFQYTMDGDLYDSNGELMIMIGPRIKFVYV